MKKIAIFAIGLAMLTALIPQVTDATALFKDKKGQHNYLGLVPVTHVETISLDRNSLGVADLKNGDSRLAWVEAAISESDQKCEEYFSDIGLSERVWETLTTVAGIGFTTSGATAKFAATKTRMAAGVAASTSLHGIAKEQLLGNSSSFLLTKAIEQYRLGAANTLRQDVKSGTLNDDGAILAALQHYHSACTINQALVQINDKLSEPPAPPPADTPKPDKPATPDAMPAKPAPTPASAVLPAQASPVPGIAATESIYPSTMAPIPDETPAAEKVSHVRHRHVARTLGS